MKRTVRYILTGLIVIAMAGATAQTDNPVTQNQGKKEYPKHEIGVSYGVMPIIGVFYWGNYDDVYPFYENSIVRLGCINTQYRLHINKTHSLNFNFSWAMYEHNLDVRQNGIYKSSYVHHMTFQIGYSIHYFKRNAVSLYSSLYGGVLLSSVGQIAANQSNDDGWKYSTKSISLLHTAFHLTILGIRLGRDNAANIELGFGTQGILKLGYNYQF